LADREADVMTKVTGACLCGATTYEAALHKEGMDICHCTDCQKWSGGPFMGLDVRGLEVSGEAGWFKSSDWGERGFCRRCGSALFWRLQGRDYAAVAAGSVDDPSLCGPPAVHIFADSKRLAYEFKDDAPRLTGEETARLFAEMMGEGEA
jgi:hypothetical protein